MKLSMWILADWLAKYKPSVNICEGHAVLSGVRLFSVEDPNMSNSIVYIGRASDFFPDKFSEEKVLCVNNKDWIMFDHKNLRDVLNDILKAFEFYNEWETSLKEAAYSGESFQALLDLSQSVFNNPMFIADWCGKVLAQTSQYEPGPDEEMWEYMILHGYVPAYAYGRLKQFPEQCLEIEYKKEIAIMFFPPYNYRCIHCSINYGKGNFIYFHIIQKNTVLTNGMIQLAETLKQAILILLRFINLPTDVHPASVLFSEMLSGKLPDDDALKWVMFTMGWEDTKNWYLISFHNLYPDQLSRTALLGLLEHHIPQGFTFIWKTYLIMLIDCQDWPIALPRIQQLLKDGLFCCGVSMPFSDWSNLSVYLKQAEVAIEYSQDKDIVNMCADHAWSYLLNEFAQYSKNTMMLHPAINQLEEYDRKKGTELTRTLYEYLRNERNCTITANALFIHRNSLQYRLGRIYELIDADLDNPDVRMHIMLSYQIKEHMKKYYPENKSQQKRQKTTTT